MKGNGSFSPRGKARDEQREITTNARRVRGGEPRIPDSCKFVRFVGSSVRILCQEKGPQITRIPTNEREWFFLATRQSSRRAERDNHERTKSQRWGTANS